MISRGSVWDADLWPVVRPVVVVSRESAIPALSRVVAVAITRTLRGHVAEVELGQRHGVEEPSAANCDSLITIAKERLVRHRGDLDPATVRRLNAALVVALGLDVD